MIATRALVILSAGLCLLGADFSRGDLTSLVLGQTTEQQVRERFGDPGRQSTSKVADKVVTSLHYSHAEPRSGLVPSRAMVLYFHGGSLVGFDFTSSFTVDDTSFEEGPAREIKRGVTTRAEMHRLVGRPAGEFVFPSPAVRVAGQRADIYNSSRTTRVADSRTLETTSKYLLVTFDEHDVVIETNLSITTTSKPL